MEDGSLLLAENHVGVAGTLRRLRILLSSLLPRQMIFSNTLKGLLLNIGFYVDLARVWNGSGVASLPNQRKTYANLQAI